ncbi:hypothetical protein KUCAC02_020664, partial [Chaenocephalus aceratus]
AAAELWGVGGRLQEEGRSPAAGMWARVPTCRGCPAAAGGPVLSHLDSSSPRQPA